MHAGKGSRREVGIAHGRKVRVAVARLRANLVPSRGHGGGANSTTKRAYDGLGAELARIRADKRLELEEVARVLYIQIHYLAAIEAGRFDKLPGGAYARGFLRAYADYLEIDAERVLTWFAEESNPSPPRSVSLPRPAEDARRPPARLIAVSLLAAVALAAAWYITSEPRPPPEEVPPPPDYLTALLAPPLPEQTAARASPPAWRESSSAANETAPAASTAAPTSAGETGPSAEAVEREASRDAIMLAGTAGTPRDGATSGDPAREESSGETTASDPPPSPLGAAGESGAKSPIPTPRPDLRALAVARNAPGEATRPREPAAAGAELPAPPPLPSASGAAARTPRRFGADGNDARVVLRALSDSWVQVLDGRNELLLTRILKPGDSYHVPDRGDLRLTTGNLGGLEFFVDGTSLGAFGEQGEVRRNLPLDAERLLALAQGR